MASRWIGVLVGIAVLLIAGIAFAPASLLDRPLAARTQHRLRLADASGFWWYGGGAITTADGTARIPIAWRIAFAPLIHGVLAIRLAADERAAPSGTITVQEDGIAVRDLRLRVLAATVAALDPRLQPVALGGMVTLGVPSFASTASNGTGVVDATWERARIVAGGVVLDLGQVSLTSAPAGEGLAGTIRNTGGDITLDGTLRSHAHVLEVTLTLQPTAATSDAVRQLLPLLGTPEGSGGVRIAWRSR